MNNDLISRSDAEKLLREKVSEYVVSMFATHESCMIARSTTLDCAVAISKMPVVDPVPHGKWIYHDNVIEPWVTCNLCGRTSFELHSNYCPNCGAKMEDDE